MHPSKLILAFLPTIWAPIAASDAGGACLPFIRSGPDSGAIETEASGWQLVKSADLAAAASRISKLEAEIESTRWDLRNAIVDLAKAHENNQSAIGSSVRSTESIASLTSRQREVLDLVLDGHPSKNIAVDLGISQRTVDNHRAAIMRKTGSKSLPALVRTAMAAG